MDEKVSAFLVKKHTLPIITLIFVICFLLLSAFIYKYTSPNEIISSVSISKIFELKSEIVKS